jgi:putative RNA 2'-phosphotransferase
MNKPHQIKISKYLSKHLRHTPERLGLTLAAGGWVSIDELLSACAAHQFPITRAELEEVVADSDKQRFSFDETKTLIRANQGHSTEVDLQLQPQTPPDTLYHGTGEKSVSAILQSGLLKMSRHHVHLSTDVETAQKVGMRHGRLALFAIDAVAMHQAGISFYCSDNGVWLVDAVPPQYLSPISAKETSPQVGI